MGAFVTGVTIVSAGRPNPHGMTLNALTSVSLVPPQVLICITTSSRMCATVTQDAAFTVSILSAGLLEAARFFAARERPYGQESFAGFPTTAGPTFGHPVFDDCVSWLECQVDGTRVSGDHTLFTGTVLGCGQGAGRAPLLFREGKLLGLDERPSPRVVA